MSASRNARPGQITQIPVTHEIRREHDDSVISAHCCYACAVLALDQVHLSDLMGGENQPGPLEYVTAHVVEVASNQRSAFTAGLVPLDGIPPVKPVRFPHDLYDSLM
ncbi:hypothetical protein [Modestobacter sp. SSW1-42]|uniref:hypothetical protein n=1 Tax=Modestobacter sp. SSW1-42 TaxID=596372 RepID=UPI0039867A3A